MASNFEPLERRSHLNAGPAPVGAGANDIPDASQFEATFVDDFDGDALDTSKWFIRDRERWSAARTKDPLPNHTSPSSVSVGDGKLRLTVHTDATAHHSGWIETKTQLPDGGYGVKFEQQYGFFEARIKFNNGAAGAWHAFWVHSYDMEKIGTNPLRKDQPEVYGNEMDVVESGLWGGGNGNAIIKSNVHYNGYSSGVHQAEGTGYYLPDGNVANYHVYGLYWTKDFAKFYVDGHLTKTVTTPAAISKIAQGMILSNEASTNVPWAGAIPAGGFGSRDTSSTFMDVDYVKVWNDGSSGKIVTPAPGTGGTGGIPTPGPTATAGVSGTIFNDLDADGIHEAGENGLAGRVVFIDADENGALGPGELSVYTDTTGRYTFTGLAAGRYPVRQALAPNWIQTSPTGMTANVVFLGTGQIYAVNFGTRISGTVTTTPPRTAPAPELPAARRNLVNRSAALSPVTRTRMSDQLAGIGL